MCYSCFHRRYPKWKIFWRNVQIITSHYQRKSTFCAVFSFRLHLWYLTASFGSRISEEETVDLSWNREIRRENCMRKTVYCICFSLWNDCRIVHLCISSKLLNFMLLNVIYILFSKMYFIVFKSVFSNYCDIKSLYFTFSDQRYNDQTHSSNTCIKTFTHNSDC